MEWYHYILILIALFILLPAASYLVAKFATAGYLRAKQRDQRNKHRL